MDPRPSEVIPPQLRAILTITEVEHAAFLAGALFQRKFRDDPPALPHHLVAFYRDPAGLLYLAGYSHMRPFGEVYLSGGSCTNGDTIRAMSVGERDLLYDAGGVLYLLLKYGFASYASRCEAFFGHCGDLRARDVTRQAGFEDTGCPHLIAHWHRPLPVERRRELIEKVRALGPF